jgi:hypothetical protein
MAHLRPAMRVVRFVRPPHNDHGFLSDCSDFSDSNFLFPDDTVDFRDNVDPAKTGAHAIKRGILPKGEGAGSKANSPDQHDDYPFETISFAYANIVAMGYRAISLVQIVRISRLIEEVLRRANVPVSQRNRAARRRKPNAFHWLDENWPFIRLIPFGQIVMSVLGFPSFRRPVVPKH